ncbi:uncharacterized protein At1g76070 [Impatiens glandulifera]|uniref:uncharacterized protein At1g76070 n=1 Tax=Impatiens glandulifera TaxID=253017 RepID=UPI001FB0C16B|nr:uncharacterized protein At1g76070 [Impatiens glandulifera]
MAMDKPPARPKSKLLKFLPKAAPSAITFHNPPFSPGRSEQHPPTKHKPPHPRSGLSVIPSGATHRKNHPKNSGDFENQEPTSPKISCMGQIKIKHNTKKINKKEIDKPKHIKSAAASHKQHVLKRIFGGGGGGGGGGTKPSFRKSKSDMSAAVSSSKMSPPNRAPALSQMQRFSSGRESLAGFDWTVHLAPEKVEHRRRELTINYYSDEEREREGDSDDEDGEPIIPFSAPLMGGAGAGDCGGGRGGAGGRGGFCLEPRKEINLWKRRTMVQPRPLQLNTHG